MIAPYLLRLVCVSLALFFAIHTVAGVGSGAVAIGK